MRFAQYLNTLEHSLAGDVETHRMDYQGSEASTDDGHIL